MYVCNAFSVRMVHRLAAAHGNVAVVQFTRVSRARAAAYAQKALALGVLNSGIGHDRTARLFSDLLGVPLKKNRCCTPFGTARPAGYRLPEVLVGQYTGPRLAENERHLPKDARIRWFVVAPYGEWAELPAAQPPLSLPEEAEYKAAQQQQGRAGAKPGKRRKRKRVERTPEPPRPAPKTDPEMQARLAEIRAAFLSDVFGEAPTKTDPES